MLTRRYLFFSSLAATVTSLRAAAPALKLGYDTHSLRAWEMKPLEHLDFAARHGCNALQISSLGEFESLEPAALAKVGDRARELGISLDVGTGCICPSAHAWKPKSGEPVENVLRALRSAKAVGARALRCFLGEAADRYDGKGIEHHMGNVIKIFRAARPAGLETGVKLALENHSGDLQAWEVKTIVEESGKDFVGSCLDMGNPIWCVESPETTLEILGPLAVTTHVRDTALSEHPRGCIAQWTACGDGCIDMARLGRLQKQLCPDTPMLLEIITGRPPRVIPYLEDDFWKGFPKARASEFARFVALVKRGHPLMVPMVIEDAPGPKIPEFEAALKKQEMIDLERSLEYAKAHMI